VTPFRLAIIGGGIGGLSAGFFAKEKFGDKVDLSIYEKADRLGGTIGVTRADGFIADWGPNGFLDKEPLTLDFIRRIGLADKLLPSNQKSERRFIYRGGRLWEISANPAKFLSSGLLSVRGRLRIGLEYFVPGKKELSDESVYDFAARRIGREAADILIDPMVSGIFGGDPEKLSLGACFPIMEEMESQYGGLIKAMIKKKKEKKKTGAKGGPAGPSGHLTSFNNGLFTIIECLEDKLFQAVRKGEEIHSIARLEDGSFRLFGQTGQHDCDAVLLAIPAHIAGSILAEVAPQSAGLLPQIPYSSLAVVCHAYRVEDIGAPVDGFGFVVPHNQKLDILGSIWTSVIFPEQAPDGFVLFRTMLGGAKNNEIIKSGEAKLAQIAHQQLTDIMHLKVKPSFTKVIIWPDAIPQYVIGHRDRLKKINGELEAVGGIYLAGNGYTGIGLNDTIKRSHTIIESIAGKFLQ
jgi:protoporphyrinogen/coproporphyrinogen III oxidase